LLPHPLLSPLDPLLNFCAISPKSGEVVIVGVRLAGAWKAVEKHRQLDDLIPMQGKP
jgi:hypothetical protein